MHTVHTINNHNFNSHGTSLVDILTTRSKMIKMSGGQPTVRVLEQIGCRRRRQRTPQHLLKCGILYRIRCFGMPLSAHLHERVGLQH